MQSFIDEQLGEIRVRFHHQARGIRFKLSPKGELVASAPPRTPMMVIKLAAKRSRRELKKFLDEHRQDRTYQDGQKIGQSHKLNIAKSENASAISVKTKTSNISVTIPVEKNSTDIEVQRAIQAAVIKVLKKEAKVYLSRRLEVLSQRHGYHYEKIRFTHTGTRWGSCSTTGTISLNIALMMLPLELIDYVLIHELCHTKQMNHSSKFWSLVEKADPLFRSHRQRIKKHSPLL